MRLYFVTAFCRGYRSRSRQDEPDQDSHKNGYVRESRLYEPIFGSEGRCCRGLGGARSTRQQLRPALIRAEGERSHHPAEPSNNVADRNRCSLFGISPDFLFVGQNSVDPHPISEGRRTAIDQMGWGPTVGRESDACRAP
jgi:hypothetical protein